MVHLIGLLLSELEAAGIPYCHWKSNIDLDKSFSAEGDLDLLVDRRFSSAFSRLVFKLGFKRGVAGWERQFPGVEDYFGWDEESDAMVHLHVHYQLVLGATYVKNIHLPMEQVFLKTLRTQGKIKVPAAETELLSFVLRCIAKERIYDLVLNRKLSEHVVEELEYLESNANNDVLRELLSPYRVSVKFFEEMKDALRSRSPWRIFQIKFKSAFCVSPFQRFNPLVRLIRKMAARTHLRWRRVFNGCPLGCKPATGGMIIAVVGSDGSGKSTMVEELRKWLKKGYAVRGSHLGKPEQSPISYVMLRVARAIQITYNKTGWTYSGFFPDFATLLTQLFVARDRRREYTRIRRWVGQGQIVVVDRFPLRGVKMDDMSTVIHFADSKNILFSWMAKKAKKYYQIFIDPDLVLVLKVSLETACRRRPDDKKEYLVDRIEAVKTINPGDNVVILDAEKELKHVLYEAKKTVWNWL